MSESRDKTVTWSDRVHGRSGGRSGLFLRLLISHWGNSFVSDCRVGVSDAKQKIGVSQKPLASWVAFGCGDMSPLFKARIYSRNPKLPASFAARLYRGNRREIRR